MLAQSTASEVSVQGTAYTSLVIFPTNTRIALLYA